MQKDMSEIQCPHCKKMLDPEKEREKILEKQDNRQVRKGLIYINWLVSTMMNETPTIVRYGKSRKREVVMVRQMSQYIARKYGHTYQSIADFFHYKRHSAVISNCKTVINDMDTNNELKENVNRILNKLKEK